ncbi:MAG: sporulation initiation factor Spo0A C-terminal domain-containing protein [Clostridia bacterium]|nr:sporulation initiation factor Spo0A C-terminal domain-containing protein [Clostridia bacterium]MDD4387458.1 sporulation initiation factor Spo0A C-terminal domain-containing protein [Clostridia bacterium]
MANLKIINVYYEDKNVSIRRVSDLTKADIIIKKDGKVTVNTQKFTEENIVSEGNIELDISNILIKIGMPVHVKGYQYIREAIKIIVNTPEVMHSVTKILYPQITKMFNTSSSNVERVIRHAIEMTWIRGDTNLQNKLFKYSNDRVRTRPTNSEFLFCLADYIRILQLNTK